MGSEMCIRDRDYVEAAALLRQLSCNLLCLQWLDLEGCAEWVPAFGTLSTRLASFEQPEPDGMFANEDSWSSSGSPVFTIFTHTWKNLAYIRCAQGWLPSVTAVYDTDRSLAPEFKALLARQAHRFPEPLTNDQYDVDNRKGRIWLDTEQRLIATSRRVKNVRTTNKCKPITWDFGWYQRVV